MRAPYLLKLYTNLILNNTMFITESKIQAPFTSCTISPYLIMKSSDPISEAKKECDKQVLRWYRLLLKIVSSET